MKEKATTPILKLPAQLLKETIPPLWGEFNHLLKGVQKSAVIVDGSAVEKIDSAGAIFLQSLPNHALSQKQSISLQNLSEGIKQFLKAFELPQQPPLQSAQRISIFAGIDHWLLDQFSYFKQFIYLAADILFFSVQTLLRPAGIRRGSFFQQAFQYGYQGLPIVCLIMFLIGFVTALQSAAQLRSFGASIFVADLLTIGITAELGPLMTAIVIAGRSGSAIAAEIATMKFTEEVDAIKTMALNPVVFVMVPKFWAMTLCLPLLTVMADFVGMLGGFVVGISFLDITPVVFIREMVSALWLKNILLGLLKSISFAWIITVTGCYKGMQFKGGAREVGETTTSSVVMATFLIILASCLWSFVIYL